MFFVRKVGGECPQRQLMWTRSGGTSISSFNISIRNLRHYSLIVIYCLAKQAIVCIPASLTVMESSSRRRSRIPCSEIWNIFQFWNRFQIWNVFQFLLPKLFVTCTAWHNQKRKCIKRKKWGFHLFVWLSRCNYFYFI